jgi:hypothetical protein
MRKSLVGPTAAAPSVDRAWLDPDALPVHAFDSIGRTTPAVELRSYGYARAASLSREYIPECSFLHSNQSQCYLAGHRRSCRATPVLHSTD